MAFDKKLQKLALAMGVGLLASARAAGGACGPLPQGLPGHPGEAVSRARCIAGLAFAV